jgi:hypothetical protein
VSARSLPVEVRDRLRAHQEAEAQAVGATTAAIARRAAAFTRRSEVLAAQDELVRAAVIDEERAMVALAITSGVERAAALLDVTVSTLRKLQRSSDPDR